MNDVFKDSDIFSVNKVALYICLETSEIYVN